MTGQVAYSKNGSAAVLTTSMQGQTQTLDNSVSDGYSSSSTAFSTTEVEFDFSSGNSGRRLGDNSESVSQAFSDSTRLAMEQLEQKVNQTVNKDMAGLDNRQVREVRGV